MKKFIAIIIVACSLSTSAFASDWTKKDIYQEIAWEVLLLADYSQTLTIHRNPYKFHEHNPIIAKNSSESAINTYFISAAILHPVISHFLPPKSANHKWINRENWQYITIGIEAGAVGWNIGIGIGFSL